YDHRVQPRKHQALAKAAKTMNQPPFEVADIIRQYGNRFVEKNRSWLTWLHLRVLYAIEFCRTATLGGHLDRCSRCGHEAISFNSCRNRHCPKCQTNARDKWLAERSKELLPVRYVHVVFTFPHELSWLILHNKKVIYDLLFRTTAATLMEIAADPRHLGAEIGFLSVLHTWGQTLRCAFPKPSKYIGATWEKTTARKMQKLRSWSSLIGMSRTKTRSEKTFELCWSLLSFQRKSLPRALVPFAELFRDNEDIGRDHFD